MAMERSTSPTSSLWRGRLSALQTKARMINMGLHIFNPECQGGGRIFSSSFRETTMKIYGSDERLSFPVQTCTRVRDVKEALGNALMVQADDITIVMKQGCSSRIQLDIEEIGSHVTVKGIESFKPTANRWPHPTCIVGSGYHGLKTCIAYVKSGNSNIVCFDRNSRVGGYCWITAANKTSKLQTEMGSFHVWWGQEFVQENCGYPASWECWPKKAKVLEHFQHAAESYGVLPHIRFRSNVSKIDIMGDKGTHGRFYELSVTPVDGEEVSHCPVSVIYSYPGSMTRNRIVEYPGEDIFGGQIGYGMNDDVPFDYLQGNNIAILGNGAFAVENIRTCCEYGAEKVFLLTRRKNLASPRVPCWFVHQGPMPTPGRLVLKMFEPMYALVGFGDPWAFWSVHASSDRQNARIIQNSRFGIGDVTFLAIAWGKAEFVEDTVKRFTRHTVHLNKGRKLEGVTVVVKSLGLLGDFAVDRLHKMNKFVGTFCDGDWRRPLMIDAPGMNAANFTTFSTGIGTTGFVRNHKFLHDFPKEYYRMQGMGFLESLPSNKANLKEDKPCYVTNVDFMMNAGVIMESMCPKLSQLGSADPDYKYKMYHACHPLDKFLEECVQSWDEYQETWRSQGWSHEHVPYPYTRQMVEGFFAEYSQIMGFPVSPDGPPQDSQVLVPAVDTVGQAPPWASDEGAVKGVEQSVQMDHALWWNAESRWLKVPGTKERKWGFS